MLLKMGLFIKLMMMMRCNDHPNEIHTVILKFCMPLCYSNWFRRRADFLLDTNAGINHFHKTPNREWFETDAVLRVSLGNFLFFSILSLLMVGVKNQKDPRDGLHHGGWMMKVICWCLLVIFMFFLPNEIISFYGKAFSPSVA